MFPGKSCSVLQNALTCHRSVSQAALFLSSQNLPHEIDDDEDEDLGLSEPAFPPAIERVDRVFG